MKMEIEDPIHKISREIYEQREYYIDLFCKTFLISQEPKSLEELRALFEICEMEIKLNSHVDGFNWRVQLKMKEKLKFDEKNDGSDGN